MVLSRIDLALVTSAMIPVISEVTYAARGFSDHSPLILKLISAPYGKLILFPSKESILHDILAYGTRPLYLLSFFLQQPYSEDGQNTGHLLTAIVKAQKPVTQVVELQVSPTKTERTTVKILSVFFVILKLL